MVHPLRPQVPARFHDCPESQETGLSRQASTASRPTFRRLKRQYARVLFRPVFARRNEKKKTAATRASLALIADIQTQFGGDGEHWLIVTAVSWRDRQGAERKRLIACIGTRAQGERRGVEAKRPDYMGDHSLCRRRMSPE